MSGFFLSGINRIYKSYTKLFELERGKQSDVNEFNKRWGWFTSTKLVADYENISVSNAYELNIFYYLNILAYLKDKAKEEEEQYKQQQWKLQQKNK